MSTDIQAFSSDLVRHFYENIEWWDGYNAAKRDRSWFVLNSFAHALNGEDLEYFTGHVHDAITGEIQIVAYTAEHLIYFHGIPDATGPRYRVIPRSTLSGLEIITAPVLIVSKDIAFDSEGSYGVSYGNDVSFILPLGTPPRDREPLARFVPSLWADLTK